MQITKFIRRHFPPLALLLTLSTAYLLTLAPGLTWANNGSDGGDLVSAAYTNGIPHPTGYPTYLLLARLFQWMPVGSLAYRTHLLSAAATVLASLFVYQLVAREMEDGASGAARLAGLTAGFAFGFSPLVWSQAVITEVYALHSLLVAALLFFFIHPPCGDQKNLDLLHGLLMGLTMGNHLTAALLLPFLFFPSQQDNLPPLPGGSASSIIRKLIWLLVGLSIYLTLPLRAGSRPPINWGNPVTLKQFWWLVSGELYRGYYLQFSPAEIWGRMQDVPSFLLHQFGWLGFLLAVAGLIVFFKPSRLYLSTIWVGLVFGVFAILYASGDSDVYFHPASLAFAVWIGLGVGHTLNRIRWKPRFVLCAAGFLLLGYFASRAFGIVGEVDASQDRRAEAFGRQVLAQVPKDALVFVKGDRAVFAVWYFHFALDQRPDMTVIAEELLHFDWYLETLRETYPALAVPGPFPWAQNVADANPDRPVCYVQYTTRTELNCRVP
jgi:hypothetical protein